MQFQAIEQLNKKIKENLLEDARGIVIDYDNIKKSEDIRVLHESSCCLEISFRMKELIVLMIFETFLTSPEVRDVKWHSILLSKNDVEWINCRCSLREHNR